MSSTTIETLTKMLESLPETARTQVVEHLREYIETLQDDLKWDAAFNRTQSQLTEVARQVRQEISEGRAKPMDFDEL